MPTKQPEIGTISHGTLKLDDLAEAFLDELLRLVPEADTSREYGALVRDARAIGETIDADSDVASSIIDDLSEALSEQAPPYCYFGTHEGDGSDFGFWVDFGAIADDEHAGYLLRVDDASKIPERARVNDDGSLAEGPEAYLVVNDHGNCTCYVFDGSRYTVRWDCV